jgi:hypothetical protein
VQGRVSRNFEQLCRRSRSFNLNSIPGPWTILWRSPAFPRPHLDIAVWPSSLPLARMATSFLLITCCPWDNSSWDPSVASDYAHCRKQSLDLEGIKGRVRRDPNFNECAHEHRSASPLNKGNTPNDQIMALRRRARYWWPAAKAMSIASRSGFTEMISNRPSFLRS